MLNIWFNGLLNKGEIMKSLLFLLALIPYMVLAQSEPVTRMKGASDGSYKPSPNIVVPNQQATRANSTTARIETGNHNLVKNPSAEYDTSGWAGSGLQRSSSTSTDGDYSFSFDPASGARQAYQSFSVPSGLIGREIEYSVDVNASGNLKICAVNEEAEKCETYIGGSGSKRITILHKPTISTNAFYIQRPTTTATPYEYFDNVYVGMRRAIDVYVSDVKNSTSPTSYTPTFEGVVATIHNAKYYKDGEFLNGTIDITTTSTSGVPATFSLPSGLTIDTSYYSTSINYPVGSFVRGAALSTYQSPLVVLLDPAVTGKLFVGSMSSSTSVYTKTNGNAWVGASERVTINFRVKISQWQNSSLDIAATQCQEGDLKCRNWFQISVNGSCAITTTGSANNPPNHLNWITYTQASTGTCTGTYNPALALKFKMRCFASPTDTITNSSTEYYTDNETTTGHVLKKVEVNAINRGAKVICFKSDEDVNPMRDQFTNLQNFYVDANEIQVGFDRIDKKPIYQRCYKHPTQETVNKILTTWPTNLNPVDAIGWFANLYVIKSAYVNTGAGSLIQYQRNTGDLIFEKSGAALLLAGEKICMKYTR